MKIDWHEWRQFVKTLTYITLTYAFIVTPAIIFFLAFIIWLGDSWSNFWS